MKRFTLGLLFHKLKQNKFNVISFSLMTKRKKLRTRQVTSKEVQKIITFLMGL